VSAGRGRWSWSAHPTRSAALASAIPSPANRNRDALAPILARHPDPRPQPASDGVGSVGEGRGCDAAQQKSEVLYRAGARGGPHRARCTHTHDPPQLKIALCQTAPTADKATNIRAATAAIAAAAARGADVVVLPEMWHCPYGAASFPVHAEDVDGGKSPSADALAAAARAGNVVVVGGSVAERGQGGKLYNTALVYDSRGTLLAKHRKAHLFDIDIPGKITFRESDTLTAGDCVTVVDIGGGVILGVGICYDLRFPEYASLLVSKGASILVYPGAFNTTTGPAHWELLARARAVDAQAFVALCSPARDESAGYVAHGHSMVVDPWGVVLVDAGEKEGIVVADVDLSDVAARRAAMPLTAQRRRDMYELAETKKRG